MMVPGISGKKRGLAELGFLGSKCVLFLCFVYLGCGFELLLIHPF